jgi:hypothetical protein
MTDLLSPAAAALELCISEKTLKKRRQANNGPPFVRTSTGRVLYRKEDIKAWRATQVVTLHYAPLECAA